MPNDKEVLTDEEREKIQSEMRERVNKIINKPAPKTQEKPIIINGRKVETAKPINGDKDDFDLPDKTQDNFCNCESCQ
ncbi:MAG: hypothetical protein LBQ52_04640 [Helicobacteraceae bacterium]|jgi:hypothetical protein|nr:hypothetical protein [Helicobacteraceae bacterium]